MAKFSQLKKPDNIKELSVSTRCPAPWTKHVRTITLFILQRLFHGERKCRRASPTKTETKSNLVQPAVNTPVVMMQGKEKPNQPTESKHLKKRKNKKKTLLIVGSLAWNNILQISYWENYRGACWIQGKGARPDRDEDPHGQKKGKKRKPTHRRVSSPVGDGEKK